jgi:hypothetical protein
MTAIERDLADLVGSEQVLPGTTAAYLSDATYPGAVPAGAEFAVLAEADVRPQRPHEPGQEALSRGIWIRCSASG